MSEPPTGGLTLQALQTMILQMYGWKDAARGDTATFLWLAEEVGELAAALRSGSQTEVAAEMADVLAWLATLANIRGVDLAAAFREKYGRGCPACGALTCHCNPAEKP
jgi:NTP pyrophosphatase (non-canonical NTP hydrolase)